MLNPKVLNAGRVFSGIALELSDMNGRSTFFFRVDYENPAAICGDVLVALSVWLAENGYMPTSDGGQMVLGG